MKFELHDTVRLIHSGEEGKVVEILSGGMVKVEVEGVVFPVFNDQLEYPYFHRFQERRKQKKEKKIIPGVKIPREEKKPEPKEEKGFFLSVLPVYENDEVVKELKLYLVNETFSSYSFHFKEYLWEELEVEIKGDISPFSRLFVKDFLFENLNDHPKIEIRIEPKKPTEDQLAFFVYSLKLKAKPIFKQLAHLEARREAMFSYLLFEKYPEKKTEKKVDWIPVRSEGYAPPEKKCSAEEEMPYEIDLHLEKLTDQRKGMTPTDMLLLQLATLEKALDRAIAHHQYSLVIIHGVGKGVLKREVHALLKRTPNVKSFINQHDFRYGFGATEVFFEYPE